MVDIVPILENIEEILLDESLPLFYRYHLYKLLKEVIEREKNN